MSSVPTTARGIMIINSTTDRSPLHPNALTSSEMTVGRKIIIFNRGFGILDRTTVVEGPHLSKVRPGLLAGIHQFRAITVKSVFESGASYQDERSCADAGLEPYSGIHWNDRNFTIDASDEHLLPEPDKALAERDIANANIDEEDEESEDYYEFDGLGYDY